jgi:hypothetical protein
VQRRRLPHLGDVPGARRLLSVGLDRLEEGGEGERLLEHDGGAGLEGVGQLASDGCGHGHDPGAGVVGGAAHIDPRTVGQGDVGHDDVEGLQVDDLQGAGDLGGVADVEAVAGEGGTHEITDVTVVIAHQRGRHTAPIGSGRPGVCGLTEPLPPRHPRG